MGNLKGYYWNNANNGTWGDLKNKGIWYNYTQDAPTLTTEEFKFKSLIVTARCIDTTYTTEDFYVFASRKNYYISMSDSLPDYYRDSIDIDLIKKMAEMELQNIDFYYSAFINTIIVNLVNIQNMTRFEQDFGLANQQSLGYTFRKKILLAHYYTIFNTCTFNNLTHVLEIAGCLDIEYVLVPAKTLTISLSCNIAHITEINKLVRQFIPAHLGVNITFSKAWGNVIQEGNWGYALNNHTWKSYLTP